MSLQIITERCPQSHSCPSVPICPVAALQQKGFDAPTVDRDKCTACGACVRYCPRRALRLD